MKKIVCLFGLLLFILSACIKNKTEDPVPSPSETTAFIDSANVSGFLKITDTIRIEHDTILVPIDTVAYANFYDVSNPSGHIPTTVNAVSENGAPLPYYIPYGGYFSSLNGTTIIPANWNVKGSGTIPSFNYTNLNGMPVYRHYNLLPSSIDRSKDLVIPLTGFTNTRYLSVIINDHVANAISLGSPPGNSRSLTFISKWLSGLTPNPETTIEVRFENINYRTADGKTFGFMNEVILKKKIVLR